jgi:multidrug efflux pump subunit AcrA (membrane-fusion protein)
LLYVIAGFIFCSVIWAIFAPMDVIADARGAVVPEGEVRPLQALEAGTVTAVRVREGDKVVPGETLVQLDDTLLQAKHNQAKEEYEEAAVQVISLRGAGADSATISSAESRVTELKNALDEVDLSLARTRMTAPIGGTVTAVNVRGAGVVVQEGQTVAAIAPQGARLVAEVHIPNESVGLVHPGLGAKILIDAYPYQHYGTVDGIVLSVSPDAVTDPDGSSYYRAVVVPTESHLTSGLSLRPGLSLNAQIVTDHRTVMSLFLDPFQGAKK